jgi:hypothetical protein
MSSHFVHFVCWSRGSVSDACDRSVRVPGLGESGELDDGAIRAYTGSHTTLLDNSLNLPIQGKV